MRRRYPDRVSTCHAARTAAITAMLLALGTASIGCVPEDLEGGASSEKWDAMAWDEGHWADDTPDAEPPGGGPGDRWSWKRWHGRVGWHLLEELGDDLLRWLRDEWRSEWREWRDWLDAERLGELRERHDHGDRHEAHERDATRSRDEHRGRDDHRESRARDDRSDRQHRRH